MKLHNPPESGSAPGAEGSNSLSRPFYGVILSRTLSEPPLLRKLPTENRVGQILFEASLFLEFANPPGY